ncbi:MAG: hypothetical protein FJ224_01245 [Lentisphaerae bacterium]|nr:hypothetical protein [Lentisphaerota bacterium]
MIGIEKAREVAGRFRGRRVLVVGDLMLDRYVAGSVSRISPEAPVPVVLVSGEYTRPGGTANVALNVQSLGGQAVVVGVVSDDADGRELLAALRERGVNTDGVVVRARGRTTCKTRVLAERQQVVRVDREDGDPLDEGTVSEMCARIEALAPEVSGVVLEDYGKGALCQPVVDAVRRMAEKHGLCVGYDPKDNHELDVSGITFATPNWMEACVCLGVPHAPLRGDPAANARLADVARRLLAKWRTRFLIVTLGPHGMYLLENDGEVAVIPTRAREVFDVSGAGDTVIATCTLAVVAGASHREAASLANAAAGVVVGKLGTATCTSEELLGHVS